MDLEINDSLWSEKAHGPVDEESLAVRDLLAGLDPCELAICISFLQQSVGDGSLECMRPETLGILEKRVSLPGRARKKFVNLLSRLVKAQEGPSRLEITFLRHIWHEVTGDWEKTVGAPGQRTVTYIGQQEG